MITRMFSTVTLESQAILKITRGGLRRKADAATGGQARTGLRLILDPTGPSAGPRLAARHSARMAA